MLSCLTPCCVFVWVNFRYYWACVCTRLCVMPLKYVCVCVGHIVYFRFAIWLVRLSRKNICERRWKWFVLKRWRPAPSHYFEQPWTRSRSGIRRKKLGKKTTASQMFRHPTSTTSCQTHLSPVTSAQTALFVKISDTRLLCCLHFIAMKPMTVFFISLFCWFFFV